MLGKGEGPTERSCVRRTWPCCFDKWTRWNARGIFSGSFFDMLKFQSLDVTSAMHVRSAFMKCEVSHYY